MFSIFRAELFELCTVKMRSNNIGRGIPNLLMFWGNQPYLPCIPSCFVEVSIQSLVEPIYCDLVLGHTRAVNEPLPNLDEGGHT